MPDKMPEGQGATLFNSETGAYEFVPAAEIGGKLASGKYQGGGTVDSRAEGGVVARPVGQLGAAVTQGEGTATDIAAGRAQEKRHSERLDAVSDPLLTFAEGIIDAASLGFIHGTSEEDQLRRQADSGSALIGQIIGVGVGLGAPGLVRGVTKGGEALGKTIAKNLLGRETGAIARGVEEAAANAALMSATAFGHQVTDAVIADKPFSGEVITHEAGLASMIGFGFGWLGSSFGKIAKASRGAVEASGVASKEAGAALAGVRDVTRVLDDAVETHAQRLGVAEVFAKEGKLPDNFIGARKAALKEAEKAKAALDELHGAGAFEKDGREFAKWRSAVERYRGAVDELDGLMSPQMLEMAAAHPVKLGEVAPSGGARAVDTVVDMAGKESPISRELDALMTPERRAQYEALHGRPYEDMPPRFTEGEENLGGVESATSEKGTNAGSARGRKNAAPAPQPSGLAVVESPGTPVADAGDVSRFQKPVARGVRGGVIDAQWRTMPPGEVTNAGRPALTSGENGAKFAEFARAPEPMPSSTAVDTATKPTAKNMASTGERSPFQKYMDDWHRESSNTARVSPGDIVDARMQEVLEKLAGSGSRLDSAGALELGQAMGIPGGTTPLGQRLDQVWSMNQAGKFAADEARGVATPLRKGLVGVLQRYALRRVGRGVAGAVTGGALGGPLGAVMGYALTSAGFAGSVAAASGKMVGMVAKVGDALLRGPRLRVVARAAMGNRPYQYDETGPIKDPIERILAVQRLAADPERLRAQVRNQLGDLVLMTPELATSLEDTTIRQIQSIAVSAPAIHFTPLGRMINPTGTAMQRFFDYENAVHDLPGTLRAIETGGATAGQVRALHVAYPAVHAQLVRNVMGKAELLKKLSDAKLHGVERILGFPLTRAGQDPAYTMRMQAAWQNAAQQPAGKPQALKITAPPPTMVQTGSSGRAPGNERKP